MRLLVALLVSWCFLAASPVRGQQSFPYKAYITADDVYVRSGPGQSYYPTDKLKAGQPVDVYRHDPGGWYAVRPPKGSFTWVSGRYLKWDGNGPEVPGIATVNGEGVVARVGSAFSDIRDVISVRLNDLEPVEVLEARRSGDGPNARVWYKIAPPSGEFRWVFGKYVDPDYPHEGIRKVTTGRNPIIVSGRRDADMADPAEAPPRPMGVRPADDETWGTGDNQGPMTARRTFSPEEYREELERIDTALSFMVVEEPTVWKFDGLNRRAESLLAQAETALERGRAKVLVRKIADFEGIGTRYAELNVVRRRAERTRQLLAERNPSEQANRRAADADDRFDGIGELTRVESAKADAPRYALLDDQGKIRCYVSAAPGVRLQAYVGRRIGVNGTRGYMLEQRTTHVMARHISPLDGAKLR